MIIDPNNEKHIIADEGKVFIRTISEEFYGKEIYLGYTYYINGELVDPPHLDTYEDFSEIDEPIDPVDGSSEEATE